MRCKVTMTLVVLLLLVGRSFADTVIDTTASWDGSGRVTPFGDPNTATYGQTFTAPGGTLKSFTFYLSSLGGPAPKFDFYVMQWDAVNNHASGSILFESGPFDGPAGGMTPYVFNTGAVSVTAGAQYVAFISVSSYWSPASMNDGMGYLSTDVYSGGGFWFFNNADNFGALTSSTWENFVGGGLHDTAFKATFGPAVVPVPSALTAAPMLFGLMVAVRIYRRTQHN